MLHAYDGTSAREDTPGSLHWHERSDRHWTATSPMGGHYEIVPTDGVYQTWRMSRSEVPKQVGQSSTMGGALMLARKDLERLMYPDRTAAAAHECAGEDCGHTHPSSVPTAPCPDPSAHGTLFEQTRVAVEKTRLVAAEGRRPRGGRKVIIACEKKPPKKRAALAAREDASESVPYATSQRDPAEVEAGRALGVARNPEAIYRMVCGSLAKESQEVFLTIPLDLRSQPLSRPVEIARGQNDRVTVEPRDILAPAVAAKAKGFVAIHVHPSGHAKPSQADKQLTAAIAKAAEVMRIDFIDHVIVACSESKGEFFSFRENGFLGGPRKESLVVHKVVHEGA